MYSTSGREKELCVGCGAGCDIFGEQSTAAKSIYQDADTKAARLLPPPFPLIYLPPTHSPTHSPHISGPYALTRSRPLLVRKSNPANLALAGMALSHFGKCFLNRSIFTYMCMSAHAKKARLEAGSRNVKKAIKIVSSVHRMLQFPTNREIVSSAAPQRKDVGAPTDRHGGARSARVARATFSGGRVAPTSMSPWFKRKHVAVVESTTTARRTFVRAVSGPAAAVGSPRELSLSPQQERKTNKGAGKVLVGGKASPIALASVRRDEDSVSCADLPQEEDHTTFFERRRHFFMRGKGGARAAAASVSGTMAADMATDIEHGLLAEPLTVSYGSPVAGRPNLPPLGGLSDSKHGED